MNNNEYNGFQGNPNSMRSGYNYGRGSRRNGTQRGGTVYYETNLPSYYVPSSGFYPNPAQGFIVSNPLEFYYLPQQNIYPFGSAGTNNYYENLPQNFGNFCMLAPVNQERFVEVGTYESNDFQGGSENYTPGQEITVQENSSYPENIESTSCNRDPVSSSLPEMQTNRELKADTRTHRGKQRGTMRGASQHRQTNQFMNRRRREEGTVNQNNQKLEVKHGPNRGRQMEYRPRSNFAYKTKFKNELSEDRSMASNAVLKDRLKYQLEEGSYECMICCQSIKYNQQIWTCQKCYHMFHMNRNDRFNCIIEWSEKSYITGSGWRCPSCQNISLGLPKKYLCFCGKTENPLHQRIPDTPHSCNSICGKNRSVGCPHPCTDICHPGPCPDCPSMTILKCNCGTETKAERCGKTNEFKCSKICSKLLNCLIHRCKEICHAGGCDDCDQIIEQTCHCGSANRTMQCAPRIAELHPFSCDKPCIGCYSCGVHPCQKKCHMKETTGDCGLCPFSPESVVMCPCGRTSISHLRDVQRKSCADEIPTCNNTCNKELFCGSKDVKHFCKEICHTGPCPPCQDQTSMDCRCGTEIISIPCSVLVESSVMDNLFICDRKCNMIKSCGIHRCRNICCSDTEHICTQICNKLLSCGNHNCDHICHRGQCPKCLEASFEEQYCLCGQTVRYPPISCGTPLPECSEPCSREHPCGHAQTHSCHAERECPPCVVLTQKSCYGNHQIRSNIPCYLNDVSCGLPCNAELPCGVHTCKRICHSGDCVPPENPICKQLCPVRRVNEACDHICGLLCHGKSPCPESICGEKVLVTCKCSRKSSEWLCADVEKAFKRKIALSIEDRSEDEGSASKPILRRTPSIDKFKCLSCDPECLRIQRNRRVAKALEIPTDTDSNKLSNDSTLIISSYSDFLKNKLKTSRKWVLSTEDILVDLTTAVELDKSGETKSHSFKPMISELRRFIHEYAQHFNIETYSLDSEPLRNVVAVAKRGISRSPPILLSVSDKTTLQNSQSSSIANDRKGVFSLMKNYSWNSDDGMLQLQSTVKVCKRGSAQEK